MQKAPAPLILAAQYQTQVAWVVLGTTLGMLIANVPVIFAGKWLMQRIPQALAHKCAFVLFILLAIITMTKAYFGYHPEENSC